MIKIGSKNTAGERFEPRNLKTFDPVTQELYRHLSAMNHTQEQREKIEP
jgi:hypothetical protein